MYKNRPQIEVQMWKEWPKQRKTTQNHVVKSSNRFGVLEEKNQNEVAAKKWKMKSWWVWNLIPAESKAGKEIALTSDLAIGESIVPPRIQLMLKEEAIDFSQFRQHNI